jgi:hypothetical protein
MDVNSAKLKEFILFQIHRNIVNLYKKQISLTEDLLQEHKMMLYKVKAQTSESFSKNIDYFTEDKDNYIRKKILDMGNEAIRDLDRSFEIIDINLSEKADKKIELGGIKFKSLKVEGGFGKPTTAKGKLI